MGHLAHLPSDEQRPRKIVWRRKQQQNPQGHCQMKTRGIGSRRESRSKHPHALSPLPQTACDGQNNLKLTVVGPESTCKLSGLQSPRDTPEQNTTTQEGWGQNENMLKTLDPLSSPKNLGNAAPIISDKWGKSCKSPTESIYPPGWPWTSTTGTGDVRLTRHAASRQKADGNARWNPNVHSQFFFHNVIDLH